MRQRFETFGIGLLSAVLAVGVYSVTRPAEAAYTPVPKNAIMYFNQTTCPSGWSVVSGARGRYLVGLQVGGSLAGTQGTAFSSDLESRAVGQHNHTASTTAPTINDPGHVHAVDARTTGGTNQGLSRFDGLLAGLFTVFWDGSVQGRTNSVTTGITTNAPTTTVNNSGSVAGTNAPYVQYLVCQKN